MLRTARQTLTTFQWITMTDSELSSRGWPASRRICYTGHRTFLRRQYVDSIGCWGACETAELVSHDAPHEARLHVTVSAYRQFKSRYGLMTGRQFERHHGPHPWTRAELCFGEHGRAQRELCLANGFGDGEAAPVGSACSYAAATAKRPLGLLPVEVVLWARVLADLVELHGITTEDWYELCTEEKTAVWALGCEGRPWDLLIAARRPATLSLHDRERQAAE